MMRLSILGSPKMAAKYDSIYYIYSSFWKYLVQNDFNSNLEIQS